MLCTQERIEVPIRVGINGFGRIGRNVLRAALGNPAIEFDGRKFEYIGVPAQDHFLVGLSKATGITSFENWMTSKKPVKLGGD